MVVFLAVLGLAFGSGGSGFNPGTNTGRNRCPTTRIPEDGDPCATYTRDTTCVYSDDPDQVGRMPVPDGYSNCYDYLVSCETRTIQGVSGRFWARLERDSNVEDCDDLTAAMWAGIILGIVFVLALLIGLPVICCARGGRRSSNWDVPDKPNNKHISKVEQGRSEHSCDQCCVNCYRWIARNPMCCCCKDCGVDHYPDDTLEKVGQSAERTPLASPLPGPQGVIPSPHPAQFGVVQQPMAFQTVELGGHQPTVELGVPQMSHGHQQNALFGSPVMQPHPHQGPQMGQFEPVYPMQAL